MRDISENRLEDVAREAIEKGAARKITIVWTSGTRTKIEAPSCCQTTSPDTPEPSAERPFVLREVHERILAVLTAEPQTPTAIAHRAGYRSLQHVRQALADLKDAGKILHISEGYYVSTPTTP